LSHRKRNSFVEFFNENGSKSGILLADWPGIYCLSLRIVFNVETDPAKYHKYQSYIWIKILFFLPALRLSGIETIPRVTPNRADSKNPWISLA